MSFSEGGERKERNILQLSEDLGSLTRELQAVLDNRFDRAPQDVAKEEGRPTTANVLDEIIQNLEYGNSHLKRILSFIVDAVLPKIS